MIIWTTTDNQRKNYYFFAIHGQIDFILYSLEHSFGSQQSATHVAQKENATKKGEVCKFLDEQVDILLTGTVIHRGSVPLPALGDITVERREKGRNKG